MLKTCMSVLFLSSLIACAGETTSDETDRPDVQAPEEATTPEVEEPAVVPLKKIDSIWKDGNISGVDDWEKHNV